MERQSSSMPGDVAEGTQDMLLFAIPKKGRMYTDIMQLLQGAGLDHKRPERLDVAICKDIAVKLVFLPAADIGSYVIDGDVDMGITGSDVLEETILGHDDGARERIEVLKELNMGKCRLCLQAPVALKAQGPQPFIGKNIVTSFPNITRQFFDGLEAKNGENGHDVNGTNGHEVNGKNGHDFEPASRARAVGATAIKVVSGSVEAAVGLGLGDAVVDLVETGTTMRAAGLEVVAELFHSQAIMFRRKATECHKVSAKKEELIAIIQKRLEGYITSTQYLIVTYNCEKDVMGKCCELTPGKRSPTITSLKEEGWFSVSALVEKKKANAILDQLSSAGAHDIICTPLANTRM